MGECADVLDGLFDTIRYTQRGTPPSEADPPYTIEAHVADALAVLDAFELDRAWAIGHSWGGHLALHLLVAHPERLLGVPCIDAVGADGGIFGEYGANLSRGMSDQDVVRVARIEKRRRAGELSEADAVARFAAIWPQFFAGGESLLPPPDWVGVEASIETNASLGEHLRPGRLPAAFPALACRPSSFTARTIPCRSAPARGPPSSFQARLSR
jgi:pimeloyl-ACP methyl ester carboxylesterase